MVSWHEIDIKLRGCIPWETRIPTRARQMQPPGVDHGLKTMYAIIQDGGRQFKVEEGQQLDIDYREVSSGDEVTFDHVLAYRDDDGLKVGQPMLESASVTAEVLSVSQGPKLVVQKLRRRKNSRTKKGHRQLYTRVKINKIKVG